MIVYPRCFLICYKICVSYVLNSYLLTSQIIILADHRLLKDAFVKIHLDSELDFRCSAQVSHQAWTPEISSSIILLCSIIDQPFREQYYLYLLTSKILNISQFQSQSPFKQEYLLAGSLKNIYGYQINFLIIKRGIHNYTSDYLSSPSTLDTPSLSRISLERGK